MMTTITVETAGFTDALFRNEIYTTDIYPTTQIENQSQSQHSIR